MLSMHSVQIKASYKSAGLTACVCVQVRAFLAETACRKEEGIWPQGDGGGIIWTHTARRCPGAQRHVRPEQWGVQIFRPSPLPASPNVRASQGCRGAVFYFLIKKNTVERPHCGSPDTPTVINGAEPQLGAYIEYAAASAPSSVHCLG